MLLYLYHIFKVLRPAFSRERAWLLGCSVILGFIGCSEMAGVSSLCRFWGLNEKGYLALLHFFHARSWNHETLMLHWSRFVLRQGLALEVDGRLQMIADHSLVVKDGRHMPGLLSLRQDSETQSKPSAFRGHNWGVLGLLVGSLKTCFCLPLTAQIHQGHAHLQKPGAASEPGDTLTQRPVQMALDFALTHQRPVHLTLDAFFSASPVFERAASQSDAMGRPWVEVLTKAKKGYVASELAEEAVPFKVDSVFDTTALDKGTCQVYGKLEEVSAHAQNLVWGPKNLLIRFIWAKTSLGPIILMSSDLMLEPLAAIELYCSRMRIESTFDRLKNLLKAFNYHFWTKSLPRHSRKPKKNSTLQGPETLEDWVAVKHCWRAYERFVALACIALGILQLIALKYPQQILDQFQQFLRTPPHGIPSEGVVKAVLASLLQHRFGKVTSGATLGYIQTYFEQAGFFWQTPIAETQELCDSA